MHDAEFDSFQISGVLGYSRNLWNGRLLHVLRKTFPYRDLRVPLAVCETQGRQNQSHGHISFESIEMRAGGVTHDLCSIKRANKPPKSIATGRIVFDMTGAATGPVV